MVALNWLERRYEIYTSKSLGRERSKSWAKPVVSNFRRSLRVASPRNFARARVYFARPTIAIAKIRDYSQSSVFMVWWFCRMSGATLNTSCSSTVNTHFVLFILFNQ